MMTARLGRLGCKLVLLAGFLGSVGCQTWVAGMTLPSPHYLEHDPQFFPESPPFPLTREMATMQEQQNAAQQAGGQLPAAPPAPVVPGL
ncbi:MAG: hypothetical protein AB7K24_18910 [Gemmataceae bacterium]